MTPSRPAGVNRGDREPNAVTIAITDWTGHQDHTCPCLRGKEIEATGLDTLKFQDSLTLGHVLLTSGVHCLSESLQEYVSNLLWSGRERSCRSRCVFRRTFNLFKN